MNARFEFEGNFLEISDFVRYEDGRSGDYYYVSFMLGVESYGFSGKVQCDYNVVEMERFIGELRELYDFKISAVALEEYDLRSRAVFTMHKTGKIIVSGAIRDGYGQELTFGFGADQTVLPGFIRQLEEMCQR